MPPRRAQLRKIHKSLPVSKDRIEKKAQKDNTLRENICGV